MAIQSSIISAGTSHAPLATMRVWTWLGCGAALSVAVCSGQRFGGTGAPLVCTETAGLELFDKRIAPLLSAQRPSSCNLCHLRGLDLASYRVEGPDTAATACATMQNLIDQQLVDLEDPPASRILEFIGRADPSTGLVSAQVVEEEHEGFRAWIEWSASCFEH